MIERRKFIKSATTRTPVVNSKHELERIIARYGCKSFAVQQDYEHALGTITFVVPDTLEEGADHIPVQLEVNARAVYDAMYGMPWRWAGDEKVRNESGYRPDLLAQAERVAWRQVILWVDAALSAAASGVQPISEAFFAQTLIRHRDGTMTRIVDHMNQITAGGSWKALLGPGGGA